MELYMIFLYLNLIYYFLLNIENLLKVFNLDFKVIKIILLIIKKEEKEKK